MRLLADENFPRHAVEALRHRGHDVAWIRSDAPGLDDREVLSRAIDEGRVLITFDKDFGELVLRVRLAAGVGIVLFRLAPTSPEKLARFAVAALESRTDWFGHFSVVDESRIRMTPLPQGRRANGV